jgi:DNA-binding transcriptional LysR family regulator
MASIDLRLLRYFVAVAEEGLLTRAAARLGIQQPPLSQQIRLLERELGVTLFRRLPKGMALTECGQVFLGEAYQILERMAAGIDLVRRVAQGEIGRLMVGFTESASLHPLVPRALRLFQSREPGVALHADELNSQDLMRSLDENKLDAAFVRAVPDESSLVVLEQLLVEPMVVALPQGHALACETRDSIALSELCGEPLVLTHRPSGPGFYDAIILACRSAGFAPRIAVESQRNLVSLSMVAAGLGVAIMPASMRHVGMAGVSYRELTGAPGLVAPLYLAYRQDTANGALSNFIRHARQLALE